MNLRAHGVSPTARAVRGNPFMKGDTMTTYKVLGLGVRFAGRCAKCGRDTGHRSFEKEATVLLRSDDGYAVAHAECIGGKTKRAVGGGTKWRVEPPVQVEI